MTIVILDTINTLSYVTAHIEKQIKKHGHEAKRVSYVREKTTPFQQQVIMPQNELIGNCDAILTLSFYPEISAYCALNGMIYLSWVYEFPCIDLYSTTILNPCNRIFLPDPDLVDLYTRNGIPNVYYLPYAVEPDDYPNGDNEGEILYPITTVGTQYVQERLNALRILGGCLDRTKGYIDGLVEAQRAIFGAYFIEETLPSYISEDIFRAVDIHLPENSVADPAWICSQYLLLPILTRVEVVLLNYLGAKHGALHVFCDEENIDYGTVHPYPSRQDLAEITSRSGINLVFPSRMEHGIALLKLFETLASGGFAITRCTRGILELFEHQNHLIMFETREELENWVEFFLNHEDERKTICKSGREWVLQNHTYEKRIAEILRVI